MEKITDPIAIIDDSVERLEGAIEALKSIRVGDVFTDKKYDALMDAMKTINISCGNLEDACWIIGSIAEAKGGK